MYMYAYTYAYLHTLLEIRFKDTFVPVLVKATVFSFIYEHGFF